MKLLPSSILRDLREIEGFDESAFIAAHQAPAVTSVRANPKKDLDLFVGMERVPWATNGYYLPSRPVFTLDPNFHSGAYYVQEASSMFLERLLEPFVKHIGGLRILDLCAAPGGKSTLIASMLHPDSLLVSNEVIRPRATILEENMTRWGQMNTWVASNDPRDFGRLKGYFDIIVIDAPCSGSGLFRKDEKALTDWTEDNVQLCCDRQQRIITDIWQALKTDGILVYATCSYSTSENETILDWISEQFEVSPITADVQDVPGIISVEATCGLKGYRFLPSRVKGEGFFIAAMRKTEQTDNYLHKRFKSAHDQKMADMSGHLLKKQDLVCIKTDKEDYSALHPNHEADWLALQKVVYLRKTGLRLGSPAGKDWLPAHEVALAIDANAGLAGINVGREEALRFLKREDMGISSIEKGWQIVRYNGLGLGFIKSLGNRYNNYLPKHLRIRMDLDI